MLRSVSYSNLKGNSKTLDLYPVTLFSGPNGSGKTAAMEAIRLAMTGSASVGSSNAKIARLISGAKADAACHGEASGESLIGSWKGATGKSNSSKQGLVMGSMRVDPESFFDEIPITADELWKMSGERKWSLLERIVGKFSEPEPEDTASIKASIKAIESASPPPEYSGPSIPELTASIEGVESQISELRKKMDKIREADQAIANLKLRLEAEKKSRESKPDLPFRRLCDSVVSMCHPLINDGTPSAIKTDICAILEHATKVRDMLEAGSVQFPAAPESEAERLIQQELDSIVVEDGFEAYSEKSSQLVVEKHQLRDQLGKAEAWMRWQEGMASRAEEATRLKAVLADMDQAWLEYNDKRSQYILNSCSTLQGNCNSILSGMKLDPVSIELVSGKRNSLLVTCGSIDLDALSGGERVIYSNVLLHAMQMLGKSPCPIQFIEAAELDPESLYRLVDSLCTTRTKGNVFLSHCNDGGINVNHENFHRYYW